MENVKKTTKKTPLEKFLKDRITTSDFEQLYKTVFGTKNRKTFVLNNPEKASFEEVKLIAKLLGISGKDLVLQTEVGSKVLTHYELKKMGFKFQ